MWRVVDLGTKHGGAIGAFIKQGKGWLKDPRRVRPQDCLGVDCNPTHRCIVEKKGFKFMLANVLTDEFTWPEGEYYLAMNMLEHATDTDASDEVFRKMIERASRGVWLVMPSMEVEPQLEHLGVEFCWKNWPHHRSFYCRHHAQRVFDTQKARGGMQNIRFSEIKPMKDMSNPDLVPIRRPEGFTEKYDAREMGLKPTARLDPPVPTGWNVIVTP